MKLIIDIDEETYYKKCKWKNNGVVGLEWWEIAIANGTPIPDNATVCDIEDIKAEIEAARYGLINDGLDVALRIIDKHMEGR